MLYLKIDEIIKADKNNEKILSELSVAYAQNLVTPFVGGGMSIPLYPSWGNLLKQLLNLSFNDSESISELEVYLNAGKYELAAEYVFNKSEAFIMKNIDDIFDVNKLLKQQIPNKLLYLAYVFNTPVFTTNFDRCLERAYETINKPFVAIYNISNIRKREKIINRTLQSNSRKLFKLHGDYDDFDSLIFTKQQYREAYGGESFKSIMEDFSKYRHFLFMGCSLSGNDRYMKVIEELSSSGTYHYAFLEHPENNEAFIDHSNLLAHHGIFPIWYPHGKHNESLECLLNHLYRYKYQKDINIDEAFNKNSFSRKEKSIKDKNMESYEFKDDIIESPNVTAYETEENIKILFNNGELSLSLPLEWKSHFVIHQNRICAKTAFNNKKYDGKIVSIIYKNEFEVNWPYILIGYSNNTFYYAVRTTDVRFDLENDKEREEYEKLSNSLQDILSSAESLSENSNTTSRIFKLPDEKLTGVILSDNAQYPNKLIDCYSEDYILNKTDNGIVHQVIPNWEICARNAVYSRGATWYECYSTDLEINYGWIESNNIVFDSPLTHISKRLLSNEPVISANLEARWATKEDLKNALTYNLNEETEKNVAFITDKDVTEFSIHSIDINNRLTFIYRQDALKANQCLIADENGLRRQYKISESGRDGSIYLS